MASVKVQDFTVKEALELIENKLAAGAYLTPILLAGAPGIGKTEGIQAIARKFDIPMIENRIGNMDPTDVRGIPLPSKTDDGEMVCVDALPGPNVLPRKGPCILFLDELGHAKTATLNAWMPLLKERRLSHYVAPKNMLIVAATNRITDRAGSNAIHAAVINRCIRVDVRHNPKDWLDWATTPESDEDGSPTRVHPSITSFIAWKNDRLLSPPSNANQDNTGNDMPYPTPRSWTNFSREITSENNGRTIPERYWSMIAHGTIGAAAAAEWKAFHEVYSRLRDWREIATDPTGTELPDEPSLRWAYVGYLSDSVRSNDCTEKQIAGIMKFLTRLPADFVALALAPMLKKRAAAQHLFKCKAFTDWTRAHGKRLSGSMSLDAAAR